jgi:hypothetical protein
MKPIPKSLHTVTVIVAIARAAKASSSPTVQGFNDIAFVNYAVRLLGLDAVPDEHGIIEQCLKQLKR